MLDASKSASDIFLDYNIKVPPMPKPEVNWCYGVSNEDESDVNFSRRTLRPYYQIKYETWEDCAKRVFKVNDVSKLFAGCKFMLNFIEKYESRPTYLELILFYYNRYVEGGKKSTLPFLVEKWTHEVADKFNQASEGMEIKEIIEIIISSRPIPTRMEI